MPEECERCIYHPCGKSVLDATYCLIRFLMLEVDQSWRKRKEKKHGQVEA